MVNTSIVFDPDVDDRALDREVSEIDKKLQDVGEIQPQIDGQGLDGMTPDGIDGVGGQDGGLGTGGAAGVGALASRIPKPIAGVAAASVLPVALGGSIGVGMLSAMHSASARLQTSTSLLGQAWNNVWRPMGDDLDKLFVRPAVMDAVRATQSFEDTWRRNEQFGAIVDLLSGVSDITSPDWTDIIPGLDWSIYVPGFAWADFMADLVWNDFVPPLPWNNLLSPLAWHDWITTLGDNIWQSKVAGVNLGQFVRGVDLGNFIDVPDWLAAPGGGRPGGGGPGPGGGSGGGPPPGGGGGGPGGGGPGGGGRGPRPFQRGGVVRRPLEARIGEAGPEVVQPLSEFERMAERIARTASGGSATVDTTAVERKLDTLNRNVKRLARAMSDTEIAVDGETFGRLTTTTRHGRTFDTDPTL